MDIQNSRDIKNMATDLMLLGDEPYRVRRVKTKLGMWKTQATGLVSLNRLYKKKKTGRLILFYKFIIECMCDMCHKSLCHDSRNELERFGFKTDLMRIHLDKIQNFPPFLYAYLSLFSSPSTLFLISFSSFSSIFHPYRM